MMRKIGKLLVCLYAWLSGHGKKYQNTKVIFLPFFGRIGDMIMFMDMLEEYKKLYPREEGYRILLGCRNEAKAILKVVGLDEGFDMIELTRERLISDFRYFFGRVREIKKYRPELILHVREQSYGEAMLAHAIPAAKKLAVKSYSVKIMSRIGRYFEAHTFDEVIRPDDSMDQLSCYAELLRRLGRKNYRSKLYRMPAFENNLVSGRYVAVCPGASAANKCWPTERYAKVVDHIVEKYDCDVVLCGGKNDMAVSDEIVAKSKHSDRIRNIAGQTGMDEWISVIQKAQFIVANESAATHIAAASAVRCVCIGEQKFADKWLPYRPEEVRPDDNLPVVVRSCTLPCAFCVTKGWFVDEACRQSIKEHGVSRCVFEVTAEMIIGAVDGMLR